MNTTACKRLFLAGLRCTDGGVFQLASRRRMESLVQQLKSMTWLWNRGADRLKGWQHDEALRSLLEESEPGAFDGNTSDTSRPRLIWAQEREKRLIATKQEAEAAARSMQG